MSTFLDKLEIASKRNQSLLCIGLDPAPGRLPIDDLAAFNLAIIDATQDLVCAYKPQMAFYEAAGAEGLRALKQTLAAIPNDIPVILDAKRGDIGNTALAYAMAMFDVWGADATTVNPYLGGDSLEPFLAYEDRGVFILCRTSNPGSMDFQGLESISSGKARPLYQHVAIKANQWNHAGNIGLVVGATFPNELGEIRSICPQMPILIPGIGTQGGDLENSVINGTNAFGRRAIINASRQVLYASSGTDFASAARQSADLLRTQINTVLENMGMPW